MIDAARKAKVKLMVAYRLHLEEANMNTVELGQSGKLGDLRLFSSVFTMQVREGDIRLQKESGGGTLYDIGVYCINAARYLFRDNPTSVSAFSVRGENRRFKEVDEMTAALLRFPGDRLASFVCSFGAVRRVRIRSCWNQRPRSGRPAYEYVGPLKQQISSNGKTKVRRFPSRDQFAPELVYFSNCILKNSRPGTIGPGGAHRHPDRAGLVSFRKSGQARLSLAREEAAMAYNKAGDAAAARLKTSPGEGQITVALDRAHGPSHIGTWTVLPGGIRD